jgi:hypothetical protein
MFKDEIGKKQQSFFLKKSHANLSKPTELATLVMDAIEFNKFFIP